MREQTIERMGRHRIGAIIRTDCAELADQAMRAAVRGGIRMVEFTLTTPDALRLIREFAADPQLLVGAGTVLSVDQAQSAVEAGASFLVSPVCDPAVIRAASELDAVSMPGAYTPTEMMAAHDAGADFVKLFPAPADIPAYVRQIVGPMPFLRIFPTAGVTPENFQAVLAAGAAGVGFVSSLFAAQDLAARDYDAIERRAASIVGVAHGG